MKRLRGICLAAALLAAGAAASTSRGEFDPEAWQVVREIKVPAGAKGEAARLALDDHVWDNAEGALLSDLRIIRGQAEEVGYSIYVPQELPPRIEQRPARAFNVARIGQAASEISLDLGESPPIVNRVRLETLDENFRCAVTVEGSDDSKSWKTIRDDAAIFDFTGDKLARFTTVSFPDTRYRYLRLVVAAPPGGRPIDLTGATVFQETPPDKPELPTLVDRPVRERTETQLPRETDFILDLGAKHLPVSKILFETPGENFSREVRVSVSDDGKSWREAGGGFIFRFRTNRYREEILAAELSERFGRYLRIRILNGDNPPLGVTRIAVQGRPRYLFFPFEPDRQYRLFYGNALARRPEYEYPKVFPHVDRRSAVESRLGDPQQNPRFIATREAAAPHPWIQRNQWILYAALAIAVAGLAAVAIRVLKRTKTSEN